MQKFVLQLATNVSRTSVHVFLPTRLLTSCWNQAKYRKLLESHNHRLVDTLLTSAGCREVTEVLEKTNVFIREYHYWMPVIL